MLQFFVKMRQFLFFLLALTRLFAGYKAEGFSSYYDEEKRLFLMATFLPAHPTVLCLTPNHEIPPLCANYWPKASFFSLKSERGFDLVWVEGSEMEALRVAPSARMIYTTTEHQDFDRLKIHLEYTGFQLLTHWYWEGGSGHALFLRKDFYEAAMRAHSYSPSTGFTPPLGPPFEYEPFLQKVEKKRGRHAMEGIDFIYMINLDERPEKFYQSAKELQLYGINPYRFSAVNGWKLPTKAFDQIGMKLALGTLREPLIGSTYFEEDGKEYIHTEFMQENGPAYFIRYLARGAIGIVLSHLSVLQDAYDSLYKTIWVMEDDVEVCVDPRQISSLLASLDKIAPDWDIFFTDTDTKDTAGNHVSCGALAARPNVTIPPISTFFEKFYPLGNNFYRTGMRYGAYSMILRRSGIKKILDYYRAYRVFIPYDMDFWLSPNLLMVYYNQDIVSHRAGAPSDNNEPRY